MKPLDFAANLVLYGCVSLTTAFILTWIFDFLAPFHKSDPEKNQRKRYRGEAMAVAALTGMGLYLARHISS